MPKLISPDEVVHKVLEKFGKLIIPIDDPDPLSLPPTDLYGNRKTRYTFRYTGPAPMKEWREHSEFLKQLGVGVPKVLPIGFVPYYIEKV